MTTIISRWEKFSDKELDAIRASITYAGMMGAHYGNEQEMETIVEEINVVERDRMMEEARG